MVISPFPYILPGHKKEISRLGVLSPFSMMEKHVLSCYILLVKGTMNVIEKCGRFSSYGSLLGESSLLYTMFTVYH